VGAVHSKLKKCQSFYHLCFRLRYIVTTLTEQSVCLKVGEIGNEAFGLTQHSFQGDIRPLADTWCPPTMRLLSWEGGESRS
jgi:hypothetical protein